MSERGRRGADAGGCVFCAVVAGVVAAEVVWESARSVAFLDHRPLFPGHVLVVPREHVVTFPELHDVGAFFLDVQRLAEAVPEAMGAQGSFVANNNVVSQSVPHLHVHVVPRVRGDGLRGFLWPRHRYVGDEASAAAAAIRAVLGARIDRV